MKYAKTLKYSHSNVSGSNVFTLIKSGIYPFPVNVKSTFRCSAEANRRDWLTFKKKAARKLPENI